MLHVGQAKENYGMGWKELTRKTADVAFLYFLSKRDAQGLSPQFQANLYNMYMI